MHGETNDTGHLTWLVVNSASGSNDDDAVTALVEAMDAAGFSPERVVSVPSDELPDRAALEAAGVNLLAVFTGDGTVNAVVTGLYGWDGRVLVLPGGTQNLLARSLHGENPALEIVERLAAGELVPIRRNMILSSLGDALCEVVAGPGAVWSDVREAMRETDVGQVAASLLLAIEQSATGPMVRIAEPALGNADGYAAVRLYSDGAAMLVDGYGAQGLADYARQGLALLKRDFRDGPHDEFGAVPEVICRSDAPIELLLDGERVTGESEERFVLAPCEVVFLASREGAPTG